MDFRREGFKRKGTFIVAVEKSVDLIDISQPVTNVNEDAVGILHQLEAQFRIDDTGNVNNARVVREEVVFVREVMVKGIMHELVVRLTAKSLAIVTP